MKTSFQAALFGAAALSIASLQAQDAAGTTYARVDLGGHFLQDIDLTLGTTPTVSGSADFDPGVGLFSAFGYYLTDNLALELETGFTYNALSSVSAGGVRFNVDGDLYQVPALVNLALALPNDTVFTPFVGIGAGGIFSQIDQRSALLGSDGDNDIVFAYQAFGGVRYAITDRVEAALSYKFMGALGPEYSLVGARVEFDDHIFSHSVTLGLKFNF